MIHVLNILIGMALGGILTSVLISSHTEAEKTRIAQLYSDMEEKSIYLDSKLDKIARDKRAKLFKQKEPAYVCGL